MTVYAPYTHGSVSVGATGHVHVRAERIQGDRTPMAIDCALCEPYLLKEGWVRKPNQVPETDEQIAEREEREREGNFAVRQAGEAIARAALGASQPVALKSARPRRAPRK